MKKIVSLLMVILMAFSFMPWSVFAEDNEAATEEPEPAIEEVIEEPEAAEDPIVTEEGNAVPEGQSLDEGAEITANDEPADNEEPDVPDNGVKARASESDIIDSGTCGNNLTWTLDSEGLLTISGSGLMDNYNNAQTSPWYSQRSAINNIVIENGVTSIGSFAFYNCRNLTNITIPDSVTSINNSVFEECRSLTSVTIPNGVTSIGTFTFYNCSSLTSVTIPESVTSIESSSFEFCSSLTSITIPDNVTSISYNAFGSCSSLTSITIPASVTSIDWGAFEGCSSLNEIYILGNETTFGSSAFSGIDENYTVYTYAGSDASAYFPAEHIVYIGDIVATGTCGENLTWTLNKEGLLTISGSGPMNNFDAQTIPWYSQRSAINNIVIENGVTSIGNYAFYKCSNLTNITIPDSVTRINNSVFEDCSSLTSITIPDGVTSIGTFTFYNCSSLTGVTIPDSVTSIESSAFEYCSSLTSITIPDNVTSISYNAFDGCSGMTSITIPDSVTFIGWGAFTDCSSLTSINIPDSVTSIDTGTFDGCSSLTSITIPDSVTSIGNRAFYNCSNLKEIYILGNETTFGSSPFSGIDENYIVYTYPDSDASAYFPPEHIQYIENIIASGTCGNDVTWKLTGTESDMVLTISGTGTMEDFSESTIPWASKRSKIKTVIIENGISSIGNYAFYSLNKLESVNLPSSIINIGRSCFGNDTKLTSITIPDSVTSIGGSAFSGCSGLTSITIPDSVASIGNYAFSRCSGLTNITISDGVTSIGAHAFSECSGLTSITIPNSVTSIGYSAFSECSGLTSITIPFVGLTPSGSGNVLGRIFNTYESSGMRETVQYMSDISQVTFYIPSNLKEVTITGGTSIPFGAFSGCSGLTSISIPNSVTSIGSYAFYGGDGPTSIVIPDSVTSIGNRAFVDNRGLTSITIPESVTSIGYSAFSACLNLHTVNIDSLESYYNIVFENMYSNPAVNGAALLINGEEVKTITIPNSLTNIKKYAFVGCSGLTSITIPDNVTSIGESAFCYCSGLTSITIPDSVTSIGETAFYDCSGLTSVTIPNSISSIERATFGGCVGLKSITIPDSVTTIGGRAFYNCSGLTSVTIPDNVTSIGDSAFGRCSGLTSITIPYVGMNKSATSKEALFGYIFGSGDDLIGGGIPTTQYYGTYASVTYYIPPELTEVVITGGTGFSSGAFYNCSGLTSITIPDSVTNIGYRAFYNCSGLTSITIPDSVARIGDSAFSGCSGLTSITIPDSVTTIENNAFQNCSGLTSITIPDSVTYIGGSVFYGCNGLTSITIPDSVTNINYRAFYNCSGLTSITIPSSVTSISTEAFYGCDGLTSITIPDSVTSIGDSAFYGCSGLTSITIPDSVTSIGDSAFSGCNPYYIFYGDSEEQWALLNNVPTGLVHYNATGHKWNKEYTIDTPATCKSEGSASIHCSVCDAVDESTVTVIPKTDHTYGEWTVTTEATCTEDGSKENVCSVCEDKVTETIPAAGHQWNEEYTVDREATCAEEGSESIHCSVCDAVDESTVTVIPKTDHTYGEWTVTTEATCTQDGSKEKVCSACDDKVVETIPATGHTWNEDYTIDKEATCTDEGSKSIHCSVCDAVDEATVITIPKVDHTYGEWTVTAEATCTEDGSKEKVCSVCSDKVFEAIPAKGHTWNEDYTIDKEATCTEEGSKSIHCSVCDAADESTVTAIPKVDHTYGEWTVTAEATCTENGLKEKVCSACGDKVTETTPAKGHSFAEDFIVDTEPTCTTEGSKSRHCADCDEVTDVTVIPALGHDMTEHEAVHPTCTTAGNSAYWSCDRCGKLYSDEEGTTETTLIDITISADPDAHSLTECTAVAATCKETGMEAHYECSYCHKLFVKNGDEYAETTAEELLIPMLSHEWGEWVVTKEPSYTEEGVKERTCSLCGDTETEAIPKLNMKITSQPEDAETSLGGKVSISVEAEGGEGTLAYQWETQVSGSSTWSATSLSGSKTATMSFKPGLNLNGRKYRCHITDEAGNDVYSDAATLTVVDGPTITAQPEDVETSLGGKVSISVEATGADLTYQWQTQVSGSSTWSATSLGGSKTNTMSFKPGANLNDRKYRCVITDKYGVKVYTNAVTLTVVDGPTIIKQPEDVSTSVGGKVSISVEAEGAELTYQWETQVSGSSTWSATSLSGSKTATMSFKPGANLNGRKYRCFITDKYGVKVYTNAVTLTVTSGPQITAQPKDAETSVGGKVSISVEATGGEGELTYQWETQVSGSSTWSVTSLSGSKTATMSFKPGINLNGRKYRCHITDEAGSEVYSDAATLTVVEGPTITAQPEDAETSVGGKVTISVEAEGADLTYQWQTQVSGSSTWGATSLSGSKTATMSFKPGANLNGRKYRCVITDKYGVKAYSNAATLTVVDGPAITRQPKDVSTSVGGKVTISVEATGADLTYQWQTQVSGNSTWGATSLNGSKTATMSFKPGANLNGRKYRCVITDKYGVKVYTDAVTLTVTE